MNEKSLFLQTQGDSPRNRIWSFLIVHQEYDYSMKEIAKFAEVSYSALKYILRDLVGAKILTQTRTVGKTRMFKLNLTNPVVEKFIEFYWAVIESGVEKKAIKELTHSNSEKISA